MNEDGVLRPSGKQSNLADQENIDVVTLQLQDYTCIM